MEPSERKQIEKFTLWWPINNYIYNIVLYGMRYFNKIYLINKQQN